MWPQPLALSACEGSNEQIRTFVRWLINVVHQNNIPAQISEGLKIQLLHLLLAEPVADPTASQEGLHLHGEGNAATEASTCAVGGKKHRMSPCDEGHSSGMGKLKFTTPLIWWLPYLNMTATTNVAFRF